ncbi:type III pantothenate kinase [Devosia sp. SL43]|uniref:type III pantothenate kinase n=1 Tax=Devosia sp. SL43 TaxID=2806348 RepID=UPI001F026A57|nr:type III pantothenate kinase [Devosia sp. SL43]UJW84234.1 type III pantothenate kinase [Devosia sp. SL43]
MAEHWLLLDIGNTHTVAGLFQPDRHRVAEVRFRTDPQCTADEYRMQLRQLFSDALGRNVWEMADRAIVSTVVPALEATVAKACDAVPLLSINARLRRDFELDLPHPEQLGADRLCNVAGALSLVGAPMLIVDAGTATTFCLVDDRQAYVGGAIVPGLDTSWRALQARAAKLFSVELTRPDNAVGNTTELQIQSGVLQGYEALIEGMADRLLRDAGFGQATLIATGGCTRLIRLSDRFRMEPDLTLLGLFRYGQLNG